MVEITYQMMLSTLQTVGLLVGITYYIMTLNYTRRNQEQTLKTRNAALFHQTVGLALTNNEALKHILLLQDHPISSIEEYRELRKNPDYRRAVVWTMNLYENIGINLSEGVVDIEMFSKISPWFHKWFWDTFKEVVYHDRKTLGPSYFRNTEYLMNALQEYYEDHPELAP